MTEDEKKCVKETLELMSDMVSDMFENGYAHTDGDGEGGHCSYYIGPGVLPKIRESINVLS